MFWKGSWKHVEMFEVPRRHSRGDVNQLRVRGGVDSGDVASSLVLKAGKRGVSQEVEWRWRKAEGLGLSSETLTFEEEKVEQLVRWEETQEQREEAIWRQEHKLGPVLLSGPKMKREQR